MHVSQHKAKRGINPHAKRMQKGRKHNRHLKETSISEYCKTQIQISIIRMNNGSMKMVSNLQLRWEERKQGHKKRAKTTSTN